MYLFYFFVFKTQDCLNFVSNTRQETNINFDLNPTFYYGSGSEHANIFGSDLTGSTILQEGLGGRGILWMPLASTSYYLTVLYFKCFVNKVELTPKKM
jgi:hypothetical protein